MHDLFRPKAALTAAKAADLVPEVSAVRAAGQTLRAIAAVLNEQGYATSSGSACR